MPARPLARQDRPGLRHSAPPIHRFDHGQCGAHQSADVAEIRRDHQTGARLGEVAPFFDVILGELHLQRFDAAGLLRGVADDPDGCRGGFRHQLNGRRLTLGA